MKWQTKSDNDGYQNIRGISENRQNEIPNQITYLEHKHHPPCPDFKLLAFKPG